MEMYQEEEDYMVHQSSLEAPAVATTKNTLQDICHIPAVVSGEMTKLLHPSTSSKTCIISFDNSTVIPLNPSVIPSKPPRPPCSAKKRTTCEKLKSLDAKAITKEGEKKIIGSGSMTLHTMVERKRRLELAHKFIELSATIPGLKKKDKASIVRGAINHVEKLQKRVKELEEQQNKIMRGKVLVPYVKAKVLDKNIVIYINCEKQNGIELKILEMLENLHFFVTSTTVLPFGTLTLAITIIAKMDDAYKMKMVDLVDNVRKTIAADRIE